MSSLYIEKKQIGYSSSEGFRISDIEQLACIRQIVSAGQTFRASMEGR